MVALSMRSGLVFCFWPDGVLAGGGSGLGSAPTSFSMFSEMASAIDSALSEGALTTGCTGAAGCTGGCTAAGWSACQSYGFSRTVLCGMTCGCESVKSGLVTEEFIHIIVTAYFYGMFEVVRHNMDREAAHRYVKMLNRYHMAGFGTVFDPQP